MKNLSAYDIAVQRLRPGEHHFQYKVDDKFFEAFAYGIVEKGSLKVELELLRTERLLDLHFHITGSIELECDRSLEKFDHPLDLQEEMILKFGDTAEELDDNMEMIPWDLQELNIARFIYQFVTVAVPLKKLHPKHRKKEEASDEMVYTSGPGTGNSQDPRWDKLKELKNRRN